MTKPLVSIIMPVYNRASIVASSIQSVLDQSFSLWELIIVDDGSSDGSAQFIRQRFRDERIKVIEMAHQGVSATRNAGLQLATGDYVCFLDSDDEWPLYKLEKQLKVMNETDAQFSVGYFIDRSGKDDPHPILRTCPPQITFEGLLVDNCILFQTLMAKKEMIQDLVFENAHHEDYRLALRLIQKGFHFEVIPEVMAFRLRHRESLTANKLKSAQWRWDIYRDQLKFSRLKSLIYMGRYVWCSLKHTGS